MCIIAKNPKRAILDKIYADFAYYICMTIPYQYTYLFADLVIGFPLWLLFFIKRPDLRHKMIVFGLMGAIAGPISEIFYLKDYWHPLLVTGTAIGIEDVLFGFFAGGIGSVLYEELFAKHFSKRHKRTEHWIFFVFPLCAMSLFAFNHLFPMYHINSIYASAVAFLVTTLVVLYLRKDLLVDALASGIIAGLIFFFGYLLLLAVFPQIFEKMWLLRNISGITVSRIPMEELLWAFTYGLMIGPLYECYAGLAFQREQLRLSRGKRRKR